MFWIILLGIGYLIVNYYIFGRSLKWLGAVNRHLQENWFTISYAVLYLLLSTSLLTAFFLPRSGFQWFVKHVSNYWLGTFLYILLFVSLADLIRLLMLVSRRFPRELFQSRKAFLIVGGIVISAILGCSIYGMVHVNDIKTKKYAITVEKDGSSVDNLRVVLVADLHLGYSIGVSQMRRMVTKINACDPDLVCIAGDIFDNDYDAIRKPADIERILSGIKSRYGVYACYGNHDIEEPILGGFTLGGSGVKASDPRMDAFLENAGITLLEDQSELVADSFYLVGRRDAKKPGTVDKKRKSAAQLLDGLDKTKPVLVIDHEPSELSALSEAGVDVDLCGHTHDGQMFPGNLTVKLAWENAYGYIKKGNMHNIVTSGVGIWGPDMRVGTDSEVAEISINFNKTK